MDVHACLTCMHPTCGMGGDVMFVSMSYTQSVHYSKLFGCQEECPSDIPYSPLSGLTML